MKADIVGSAYYTLIKTLSPFKDSGRLSNGHDFRFQFLSEVSEIPDEELCLSIGYINFQYECAKLRLSTRAGLQPGLTGLYQEIKTTYSGKVREKLLANCLLNDLDMTYGYIEDCEAYTRCLEDAVATIQTDWMKTPVENLLRTRGKGAEAFDFQLPADSSGRKYRLSDFKGKVVLLDTWGYICTGCYRFAGAFHKKIYPLFKDNPDFKVVSIMLDNYAGMEQYKERLRGENGPIYTFPEYVNLYGGKGEPGARAIEEHYNIRSYPTIFLIDRHGKMFSSTVPFIDSPDSPNIDKLIALINEALNEN